MADDQIQQIIQSQLDLQSPQSPAAKSPRNGRTSIKHLELGQLPPLFGNTTTAQLFKVLAKPKGKRNPKDIYTIMNATANIDAIKNLIQLRGVGIHAQIWSQMKYQKVDPGEYVIHYGDTPDNFYIILSGKVSVLQPRNTQRPEPEQDFKEVNTLRDGQTFGDLAWIHNTVRNASIRWVTETHMLTLNVNTYRNILGKNKYEKTNEMIQLIQGLPMFSFWTKTALEKLLLYFKEVAYTKNQHVFQENDDSNEIYIIKEGEFRLYKDIPVTNNAQQNFSSKSRRQFFKGEITYLTKGQIFGQEEALANTPRKFTCVCSSLTGKLLVIKADDFSGKIASAETWNQVQKHDDIQSDFLQQRVKSLEHIGQKRKLRVVSRPQQFKSTKGYSRVIQSPCLKPPDLDMTRSPQPMRKAITPLKAISPRSYETSGGSPTFFRYIGSLVKRSTGQIGLNTSEERYISPKRTVNIHLDAIKKVPKIPREPSLSQFSPLKTISSQGKIGYTSLTFDTQDGEISDRVQTKKLNTKLKYHILGSSRHNLFRKKSKNNVKVLS